MVSDWVSFSRLFGCRKNAPIPLSSHDSAKVIRVFDGKFAGITHAYDAIGRIASEKKGGQGNREDDGFEMAGRYGCDQPLDRPIHHTSGRIRHGIDVPVRKVHVAGRHGLEHLRDEGGKIPCSSIKSTYRRRPSGLSLAIRA